MANYYTTPIDGCFNCPMQVGGRCNQPYADRPAIKAVRAAVKSEGKPPKGCILYDLPLYLHGRFPSAHPDGTEPRDRDAEDAVVELLYGAHKETFRALDLKPRDQPADVIRKLGEALARSKP
jgi:hypothetical protein